MNSYARFAVAVICTVLGSASSDLDACEEGYQIASKYNYCWTQSSFDNMRPEFRQPREVYTSKFVEAYARYMCSVVKPGAIKCLREEMADCSNIEKIVEMADESGGTCVHNDLNTFFKLHIIDHLAPVRNDSPCFQISNTSDCYSNAASKVKQKGNSISRFHYEADKFFANIWECQVKLYKSKSDICKNWQLPMLLSLQNEAMPSLFGMRLTDEHVAMLELETVIPTQRPTPTTPRYDENRNNAYILLKVLKQRPEFSDGDIVLQVNVGDGQGDDRNFVKQINGPEGWKKKEKKIKGQRKDKPGRKFTDSSVSQMID